MSKLGSRLIKAAQEGCAIARGEVSSEYYRVFVPSSLGIETWVESGKGQKG